jgi:hypothetical protein
MTNIFRQKHYQCGSSSIYNEEVNCIHWKSNNETCTHTCNLNLFANPSVKDCMSCQQRVSYPHDILADDIKTNKFTQVTVNNANTSITFDKAKQYISAETSQFLQGKVDDEIYNERKSKCIECPFRVNNINGAIDEVGWCTGCGCGVGNDRSRLSVKLRMPSLFCPKGKFQAAMGAGFKISDATDSIKGIVSMIKNLTT